MAEEKHLNESAGKSNDCVASLMASNPTAKAITFNIRQGEWETKQRESEYRRGE